MDVATHKVCHCGEPVYRRRSVCRVHMNTRGRELWEQNRGDRPRAFVDAELAEKTCLECLDTKPVAMFFRRLEGGILIGYSPKCKPCETERMMEWRRVNRAKWNAYAMEANKERRDRKRALGHGRLRRGEWAEILASYGHRCAYCSKPLDQPTRDHVVPIALGGEHTGDNIVPACMSCNASKQDRPLLYWMALKAGIGAAYAVR